MGGAVGSSASWKLWGGSPASATAREPALHGSVLLAGELSDVADSDICGVMRRIEGRCTRLTVAVVVSPPGPLTYLGPFSGVLLVEHVQRELQVEAERRARRLPCLAPDGLCVEHLVSASWTDLVRHARCRGYDTVLLADRPTRLRDRLLVRRMGWSVELAASPLPAS
jgi:hypothetical protein